MTVSIEELQDHIGQITKAVNELNCKVQSITPEREKRLIVADAVECVYLSITIVYHIISIYNTIHPEHGGCVCCFKHSLEEWVQRCIVEAIVQSKQA